MITMNKPKTWCDDPGSAIIFRSQKAPRHQIDSSQPCHDPFYAPDVLPISVVTGCYLLSYKCSVFCSDQLKSESPIMCVLNPVFPSYLFFFFMTYVMFQLYFRTLSEPLFTYNLYKSLLAIAELPPDQQPRHLHHLVHLLPHHNLATLRYLLQHLRDLAAHHEVSCYLLNYACSVFCSGI